MPVQSANESRWGKVGRVITKPDGTVDHKASSSENFKAAKDALAQIKNIKKGAGSTIPALETSYKVLMPVILPGVAACLAAAGAAHYMADKFE
jgi:hypothetical protein